MAKKFRSPTGTADFLPDYHDYFTFVKKVIRHRFRQSGFRRISTPMFEETDLFKKSLGETSEIIARELYSFNDRQGREYTLRPEVTTGIVRSFIQNEMADEALPTELYYIEPCFRFERPNSRTRRQFWQFGGEILGETDPSIDAQIMYLGHRILSDLGIMENCELRINTIGSPADRVQFFEALENFYSGKERSLSPASLEKFQQKKFLELLSPRTEDEEILVQMAPKITDFLSEKSAQFFKDVTEYLDSFGIEYIIDSSLVRPINYYSHTTFEFREKDTRNKVLVGGRYDELIEKLGGPKLGASGFAAGVDRIIDLMKHNDIEVPRKDVLQIFLAATGPVAKKKALPLLIKLREHGYHAVGVLGKTSMQDQLARAQKFKVPYILLMGDLEVKKEQIIVRDMKTGRQTWIDIKDVLPHMDDLLGSQTKLDTTMDFLGHN